MNKEILVILESPYAGDVETHTEYARRAVKDSLLQGEAPIASHLLYTQPGILDDTIPVERAMGINAGLAWRSVAYKTVVYTDYGISRGMQYGIDAAHESGLEIEHGRSEKTQRGSRSGCQPNLVSIGLNGKKLRKGRLRTQMLW